jgi:RND family efflux transporter MFP subunit
MDAQDLSKLKIARDEGNPSQVVKRWRVAAISAFLVMVGSVILGFLAWTGRLLPAIEVPVIKASATFPSRALTVLNASGYVVAQRKAAVSSKATGRLQKLYVEEGKLVKEGEILAQLENEDLQANLQEAQASLKVATAMLKNAEAELEDATLNYARHKALKVSGAVSEQAFDTAEARYKKAVAGQAQALFAEGKAEASSRGAEINFNYSFIRAPFAGVILTKNADEGEIVAPFGASINSKAAVATMADLGSLMVEADVSEASLEKVKLGAAAEIRLDALPNERFPGQVHMIVPTADRSKATVLAKIRFDSLDPRVLPEMSAKVAFLSRPLKEGEDRPFLGIPVSAVRTSNGKQTVFCVNDSRVHSIPVQTGRQWGETLEVLSGLKEGDRVIISLDKSLKDGRRVKAGE